MRHVSPQRLKTVLRRKVLVVPYVVTPQKRLKMLLCKDARYKEYGLLSGGLKRNESPATGAMRELREETKDAITISLTCWNHRTFQIVTDAREARELEMDIMRGEHVVTCYTVFVIDITNYTSPAEIMRRFKASTRTGKAYNENESISFETLAVIKTKKLWSFIRDIVLPHPEFVKMYRDISKNCIA
jgi:ADP-ribose pyrophosphatase YjhB (NUDIX family)